MRTLVPLIQYLIGFAVLLAGVHTLPLEDASLLARPASSRVSASVHPENVS